MENNANVDLNSITFNFPKTFSDKSLNQFISQIEEIPILFANSSDSLLNKLTKLKDEGLFDFLNIIFQNPLDSKNQLKFLKFWDFLISTCSLSSEFDIIFPDDLVNKLILYQFDVSSEDILRAYVTVLKGISLKANKISPQKLFVTNSSHIDECPLFIQAFNFVNNSDSIVVAAARHVVLNLCLIKYTPFQTYLGSSSMFSLINTLINNVSEDEFAFFADFLNVCPLNLREYFILKLRFKLSSYSLPLFLRAVFFLTDTPARQMIIEILSDRIQTLQLVDYLSLSLIHFSLQNRLLLLDTAIKSGLISTPGIPTFSKNPHTSPISNFCIQIKSFLDSSSRSTNPIECFALSVRCLEILYKDAPRCAKEVNKEIIDEIKNIDSSKLMSIFLGTPFYRIDCNIECLLNNTNKPINNELKSFQELIEIQSALCKWNKKKPFVWFTFPKFDENDALNQQAFPTSDGRIIFLSDEFLILPDKIAISTTSLYLQDSGSKMKKTLDLTVFIPNEKSSTLSTNTLKKMTCHIEFASANVASSFETRIIAIQNKLVNMLFDSLEY